MSDHKHDKKIKKLGQILHNRQMQGMKLQSDALARERDLEREREEEKIELAAKHSRQAAAAAKDGKPAWSAKLQMNRDKNTGRMHAADGRWNRFAGTEGGGGRGL